VASDRRAWVRSDEERREREGDLASLEGDHVTRVRYFERQYEGVSGPMWSGGDFDSLDYGLELDFASGVTWSFIWKHRGPNEGLLAFEGTLVPGELRDDAAAIWDVTDHWREHGPSTILHAGAVWDWGSRGTARRRSVRGRPTSAWWQWSSRPTTEQQ
jgi:hypothetical protein